MEATPILLEAIARQKCVAAVYNCTRMRLAPHILYTRHDDLFVDAIVVERDGKPPREVKIGTFKLTGLSEVALTEQGFERYRAFAPGEPKYEGVTLFAIELA